MGNLFPNDDEYPNYVWMPEIFPKPGECAMKFGVTAFALGVGMAIHEGHGDPPPEFHESPSPTGRVAIEFQMASTSSLSSTLSFSSLVSTPSSSNVFRLK